MIKYVDDYIDQLQEIYPNVLRSDIKKIVNYGCRMMFRLVRRGLDVQIQGDDFWFYIGELTNDTDKHRKYYKRKLLEKVRYIFEAKHQWDGYYYVGISDELAKHYTCSKPKRNVTLNKVTIFKCLDAAKVYYDGYKYFLKTRAIVDLGFKYYRDKTTLKKVEIACIRERHGGFKDLLIENNYDIV